MAILNSENQFKGNLRWREMAGIAQHVLCLVENMRVSSALTAKWECG